MRLQQLLLRLIKLFLPRLWYHLILLKPKYPIIYRLNKRTKQSIMKLESRDQVRRPVRVQAQTTLFGLNDLDLYKRSTVLNCIVCVMVEFEGSLLKNHGSELWIVVFEPNLVILADEKSVFATYGNVGNTDICLMSAAETYLVFKEIDHVDYLWVFLSQGVDVETVQNDIGDPLGRLWDVDDVDWSDGLLLLTLGIFEVDNFEDFGEGSFAKLAS